MAAKSSRVTRACKARNAGAGLKTRYKDCTAPTRFLELPHLRVKDKKLWPST
jgi:hypothetical protein